MVQVLAILSFNCVQFLRTRRPVLAGQSVIQSNQQSVIQSANNQLPVLTKGNVILVGKPNSVIQTTQGNLQTLQVVEAGSDDSLSNDEDATTRKRRDILTRRPSYRKILNDLGGGKVESSGSDCDSNLDSELSSHSLPTHYQAVIPAGTIQLTSQGEAVTGLHTLTMTNATGGSGTLVQYTQGQDGQFYVPEYVLYALTTTLHSLTSCYHENCLYLNRILLRQKIERFAWKETVQLGTSGGKQHDLPAQYWAHTEAMSQGRDESWNLASRSKCLSL
ncbi:Cyclic AMP-responsive element-binding protein 1 [Homalodisca vitripennis]|nr:Cyclic AMP-responsive element-binding protein 1 [Homalodisca vitripennis]